MINTIEKKDINTCHNPYFNRWFSAIFKQAVLNDNKAAVTILILIDGFLQYVI